MADLKVRHLVVGAVATNCYIAENRKTKEALIIDPGDNAARIVQIIKEDGVVPVAVLLPPFLPLCIWDKNLCS